MSGHSQYVQEAVANWYLGTDMPISPTSLELVLSRTQINDSGASIDEPSGLDAYTRQTITLSAPVHTDGAGTRVSNTNAIIFGPIQNNSWGTIVAAAVFDQAGNMIFKGNLAAPRVGPIGDTLSFGTDTVEFTVK